MKNVVLSFTALTLITVSCGTGHDSKREGESATQAEVAPPETASPTMIVARVPLDKVNSESFEDAEFAMTKTNVDDLAQAFADSNGKLGKDEDLTFSQSLASDDEQSLCGGGCGKGGGGYHHDNYGRIGFFGGIFRGVGRIVGGVLTGTAQIVYGAKTIVRGTVQGVGDLLYHHKPIFKKGGWGFGYGCGGHVDIGKYRYYKYERKGQPIPPPNFPNQGPGQKLPPPSQKPLPPPPPPPKGGSDLPPPPIDKGPGDEGGFCEDGCQK